MPVPRLAPIKRAKDREWKRTSKKKKKKKNPFGKTRVSAPCTGVCPRDNHDARRAFGRGRRALAYHLPLGPLFFPLTCGRRAALPALQVGRRLFLCGPVKNCGKEKKKEKKQENWRVRVHISYTCVPERGSLTIVSAGLIIIILPAAPSLRPRVRAALHEAVRWKRARSVI